MGRVEDSLTRQSDLRPEAQAIRDSTGLSVTYGGLQRIVQDVGDRLRAEGTRPGDRVLILSENALAKVAALYACWHLGAVAVPVNARQSAAEVDRVIAHAEPALLLATTGVSAEAAAHADRFGATLWEGAYGQLAARRFDRAAEGTSDIAVLLYTTGTTGAPKGVMLSHDNLSFAAETSAALRDMTAQDHVYGVLPTTHVFGLCSVLAATLMRGAAMQLVPRFDPAALLEGLRSGATMLSAVPQMHAQVMAHAKSLGLARLGSDSLRYVSSGAAPLDPTWKREAEAFYGVAVQNGYGMTETSAGLAATRSRLGDPDISCGPPLPGVELRIDTNAPGSEGEVGEVLARGPNVMRGYFRNAAETARVLAPDGWLRTGDLGHFDAAGHLHIVGRSKELIIHGGFNVYPPEVEAALNDHPEIIQAAVIGRAADGDEEVLAFCQVAPDCRLNEVDLMAFLRPRLTGYKRPKRVILATRLPAAPTGKILKHKLLEIFADRL